MHAQTHDTGNKLYFESRHQEPIFRHPYEKYNSRISNDSVYRIREGFRESAFKRNTQLRKRNNIQTGFQDKNIYICQTFLKENPFFGVHYPDARSRSEDGEGTSGRGSERTRSTATDFDDSRTYRVIHSEESNGKEDGSSVTRCKFKKSDDIHHFHEHHHFFHDKEGKLGKSKELSGGNPLIDSNISFLKQPIQESCMFYQKDEGGEARKSREGSRGVSRSTSKTGRKSSDNETYTVVCAYCQKLLRDYPNARVVGHENVPVRLSNEGSDRRPYVQYCYNGESTQKKTWIAANSFVAQPSQGPKLSHESSRLTKTDPLSKISDESGKSSRSTSPPPRSAPREKKKSKSLKERSTRRRVSTKKNSNHKMILFKCDHCKSIIQFPYVYRVLKSSSSSSTCSSEVLKRVTVRRSVAETPGITSTMMKRSNASTGRNSPILEESLSSISEAKKSFTPKASLTVDKVKSSSHKASTISSTKEKDKPSPNLGYDSKEVISERKKTSSSHNESPSMDKKTSRKERGPSEVSKKAPTTKESIEVSLSKESLTFEDTKSRMKKKKKGLSAYKVVKDVSDVPKKSSWCGESKLLPYRENKGEDPDETHSAKAIGTDSYKDSGKSVDKKSTSRKEVGMSGKRGVGTEVYMAKVEGKQKAILTKERSMQTGFGGDETKALKRSSTAEKAVDVTTDTKRSVTAPGSLVNSRSTNTRKESSALRASSTLSRRTVASKEVPIIEIDPIPEAKPGLSCIQSEISDLKSQLYRLEAMHNLSHDATHMDIPGNREATNCPKHPIVVCTSTTYIMTNYEAEHEEKHPKETAKAKESIKIPSRKKDSAAEFGLHVESTPPRPKRVYVGQMRVVREHPEHRESCKTRYGNSLGKTPNYEVIGDRMTKAVKRMCQCCNGDVLTRSWEGSKSYDRCEDYPRLLRNGKNQKRIWRGNGASTDGSCMKFTGNMESHCRWHSLDFDRSEVLKAIASIGRKQGLLTFRSCSAVFGGRQTPVTSEKIHSEISKATPENGITVENVRIEGRHGNGYFLRTSLSDICEYRNGSLIRLTGKSGWVVLTKKLFLQKMNNTKARDDFSIYPVMTSRDGNHPSAITIKRVEDNIVGSEDMLADYDLQRDNTRQAQSDSSIYLPLTLRDYNAGRAAISKDNDVNQTTVRLPRNVRHRNRGAVDIRKIRNSNTGYFSDELYLMNCRSGADRTATCGVGSEGDGHCTCRREKSGREGGNAWKTKNEAVPVLFEEMKTRGVGVKKDVSLKCVFAETVGDQRKGNRVFWTSDWCDSKTKNRYVFAVSRSGRTRSNREVPKYHEDEPQFSMNDYTKQKWNRYTTRRRNKTRVREDTPPGDSSVNPRNRCACCKCRPQHVCSGPNDKREEITGFRRLMRDVGLTGINLNFLRKLNCDRVFQGRSEETTRRRGETRKKVEIDDLRGEVRSSYGARCNCAKQIEEILNKVELCRRRPLGSEPQSPVSKNEAYEESDEEEEEEEEEESSERVIGNESHVKGEVNVRKYEESIASDVDPEVLEDIEEQRRLITECEAMLKKFEIKLEDVRRQNESFAWKYEETVKEKHAVQKEREVAHVEINTEDITEEEDMREGRRFRNSDPYCSSLPSKIEILCERKMCTCRECSNIHYIDKQYLPTSWLKKCKDGMAQTCSKPPRQVTPTPPTTPSTPKKVRTEEESDDERFIYKSDLEKSDENESIAVSRKSGAECDKSGAVSCESTKSVGQQCCNYDSKLKLIEDRLRELEKNKKTSESSSVKTKSSTSVPEVRKGYTEPPRSPPRTPPPPRPLPRPPPTPPPPSVEEKKDKSGEDTDVSSWENIESETDNEVTTKIITCKNLHFFVGGDPNIPTKCECTEDSYCPLRFIGNESIHHMKNIYFLTNIELFRHWSGLYSSDYKYCNSFWNVKAGALKPVKIHRDWRNVRSAVTSFFRRKKYNIFKRRKKMESAVSTMPSTISVESFLNDCSRSSMPLKKRSFHILSVGPHPMRAGRVKGNPSLKRIGRKSGVKEVVTPLD